MRLRMRHLRIIVVLSLAAGVGFAGPAGGQISIKQPLTLDGDWNFLADPSGTLQIGDLAAARNARPTRVPSSWQSQFADLRDYSGVAWYWRTWTQSDLAPDARLLLRFGAIDYLADVYVNGQKVGSHEGGYLPFEFDITPQVHRGENQIAVRVADPGAKPHSVVEGINYAEIPHGKQNWYVQTSGLWQSVELHVRPRMRYGAVHISAGADGSFKVSASLTSPADAAQAYTGAEILDPNGQSVWKESHNLTPGQSRADFSGTLSRPSPWSPSNPALYTLHAWLSSGDFQTYRFGFRTFETRGGKFYLNGQVVYLRAALDQDFYPDSVYTPPSLDYIKDEMQKAKAMGLNMLRCHIKVPDPRYLQAADEVGILIWYEIPNWDKLTDNSKRRGMETLRGMVERDWNHPSIVITSIINESWGANLKEADQRQWLKQAYLDAKTFVPGWLVVDNSACCENFHMATDLADFHQYNSIPDYAGDFDRFIADMATRPGWLFSPDGDAAPRGDEPLVLSEFGNWGLPRLPDTKPWWFTRDFEDREITRPDGVEQRFADYQYGSLFSGFGALADATQEHEYSSLKYEIESLRAQPDIQGYVITEFTDINWETNGLLDMWRHPKTFSERLGHLQQDHLVALRAEQRNLTVGDRARADVYFSNYGKEALSGARAYWELDGTEVRGQFDLPSVASGSCAKTGKIEFTVPSVGAPSRHLLKVTVSAAGTAISDNSLDFYLYPPRASELNPSVVFHDPGGRLRRLSNEMRRRNFLAPSGSEALPVMIASTWDDEVQKTLQNGGRVILLAAERQQLASGLAVVPRDKSDLDGNWISNFLWVRKDLEPFKVIGFETLAGFETQAVTPSAVIQGIPPADFQDVLSGMFYGWIHNNVGTLVQARAGKGRLLVCTFSLVTSYGSDPYATYLLEALVNYATSRFTPNFEIALAGN
jgi:Glycosyl hydrolases family 2, sugar binding domain/Glycosyl hydrolases family 2/Glycosyl hydrolases family 2, TIM barrel domain